MRDRLHSDLQRESEGLHTTCTFIKGLPVDAQGANAG